MIWVSVIWAREATTARAVHHTVAIQEVALTAAEEVLTVAGWSTATDGRTMTMMTRWKRDAEGADSNDRGRRLPL